MGRVFDNRLNDTQKQMLLELFELKAQMKKVSNYEQFETLNLKIAEIEKELGFYD